MNGHVYPEVSALAGEAAYAQRKVVLPQSRERQVRRTSPDRLGPPVTTSAASRGAAFGDLDNDGDIDVVVNNMHAPPDLFRLGHPVPGEGRWLSVALVGTRSHRNAIGARVTVSSGRRTFVDEVRGGGSYYAQNDFRLHFGLGNATAVRFLLPARWPNGVEEALRESAASTGWSR